MASTQALHIARERPLAAWPLGGVAALESNRPPTTRSTTTNEQPSDQANSNPKIATRSLKPTPALLQSSCLSSHSSFTPHHATPRHNTLYRKAHQPRWRATKRNNERSPGLGQSPAASRSVEQAFTPAPYTTHAELPRQTANRSIITSHRSIMTSHRSIINRCELHGGRFLHRPPPLILLRCIRTCQFWFWVLHRPPPVVEEISQGPRALNFDLNPDKRHHASAAPCASKINACSATPPPPPPPVPAKFR